MPGNKYVAIVDKTMPRHRIANAVAHLALGLGNARFDEASPYTTFKDKTGKFVAHLTDHPFIILAAKNAEQLRAIHDQADALDVPCLAYLNTMFSGSVDEQRIVIASHERAQQDYAALVLFGDADVLRGLTKRTSLLD